MDKRDYFIKACYSDIPSGFYGYYIWLKNQGLDEQVAYSMSRNCDPSNVCRFCRERISEGDFDVTPAYWGGGMYPCHKKCKKDGVKREAYDCQLIDASCNDCKHFLHHETVNVVGMKHRVGICRKSGESVKAYPNFAMGKECFEHRNG